jgi:hypothetical protein
VLTLVKRNGMTNGGSVGPLTTNGYDLAYDQDGNELETFGVRGAASAFEIAGLGAEVPEATIKPGDFAQSRKMTKLSKTEKRHVGEGHGFQIWSVRVKGAAFFGRPGSPKPVAKEELKDWHTGIEFTLEPDTDPALVGEYDPISARRIEANTAGYDTLEKGPVHDDEGNKIGGGDGDGGVLISKHEYEIPEKLTQGTHVYYARLGSSRWNGWSPAKKPE